jgi:hypothetical protein
MIPRLNPSLIFLVKKQVVTWSKELKNPPWVASPAAKTLAQGIRNSCPKMAAALEKAGILEPWAEMLHDQILAVKLENRKAGMSVSEAESQARMELVPSTPEMEADWLEANSQHTAPAEQATA